MCAIKHTSQEKVTASHGTQRSQLMILVLSKYGNIPKKLGS